MKTALTQWGIDIPSPRFGWILNAGNLARRNIRQTAYQLLVASSPGLLKKNLGDYWNSGKVPSDKMNRVLYAGKKLTSHQTLWWKLRIWDETNKVSEWSEVNQWTMGILNAKAWSNAKWIGATSPLDSAVNSTILLRREFTIKPDLHRAIISVCGLGQYEMTVNGKQLTETIMNPGWTQYDKTCLYDTYNITQLLQGGQNAIGVLLAGGMYRVKKDGRYAKFENAFGRLQAIAKITLTYKDGSVATVITDDTWKSGESPITWSSIYGGEDYDATKVAPGWDKAGFNQPGWWPVELMNGPGGELKGTTHAAAPIRKFQVQQPVSKKEIKPGVFIYDLGQDASYISTFTVTGPKGAVIKITPSELLNADGTLFRNNYNGKSYSQYVLAGTGAETYTSKFFNTGCRYYQVECIASKVSTALPVIVSIAGIVVHGDNPFAGEFSCSNELFNRIYTMIKWAELSNMKSVISDCPHRERLGWLEQSHLHGPSFQYNYDMRIMNGKIIRDMNDTKQPNGLVPCIAPELTVFGKDWREAIEWGTAGVMIPWQQYQWTGDVELLQMNFPMMKGYVDYLTSRAKDGIATAGKGDWAGRRTSPHTAQDLIATAFYYANAVVVMNTAKLLGRHQEYRKYETLANTIHEAFNKKFFNPAIKQYGTGSQCANAMALVLGLVDSVNSSAVLNSLVAGIENRKYENTTGEVGMRYVLRALADGGRSDVIYKMNNQDTMPGYGYQLKMGATALPETWDAWRDNSQNQFMLGHIIEWFYHDLVGIQINPLKPGFREFVIKPTILNDLTEVKGSYRSIHGKIVSEWKRKGNRLTMQVIIPANTNALVYIPASHISNVTENGMPVAQMKSGSYIGIEDGSVILNVGSGDYTFSSLIP